MLTKKKWILRVALFFSWLLTSSYLEIMNTAFRSALTTFQMWQIHLSFKETSSVSNHLLLRDSSFTVTNHKTMLRNNHKNTKSFQIFSLQLNQHKMHFKFIGNAYTMVNHAQITMVWHYSTTNLVTYMRITLINWLRSKLSYLVKTNTATWFTVIQKVSGNKLLINSMQPL